jgi:hypothetical protein
MREGLVVSSGVVALQGLGFRERPGAEAPFIAKGLLPRLKPRPPTGRSNTDSFRRLFSRRCRTPNVHRKQEGDEDERQSDKRH